MMDSNPPTIKNTLAITVGIIYGKAEVDDDGDEEGDDSTSTVVTVTQYIQGV